jgi:flagellar biosynthetic protein FlhB
MAAEERTEKATPKKLKQSRKEGQVARTQDLGAWSAVLMMAMTMRWLTTRGMQQIHDLLVTTLAMTASPDTRDMYTVLKMGARIAFLLSLTMGVMVLVVGVVAAIAQGGLFFATKALKPKWSRLNPFSGIKRIFGPHAVWEGAKMLLKSTLVGIFVWRAIVGLMPMVGGLVPLQVSIQIATGAALGLMRDVALAGLVAAAADYAVQRR